MGFISQLTSSKELRRSPTDSGPGRALWREVFGTSKEDGHRSSRVVPGGSWGRSLVGSDPAQVRLLQAMRSMAPGGWSDDRWEQSRHDEGMQYVAIHRKCEQLSQAEFAVFRKDDSHPDGKRPVKRGEPGYEINGLLEHPNKQDSFGDMMYRIGQQMDLTGSALTWMIPNRLADRIVELYVLPTAICVPQPAVNPDYPDGYWRIQPIYPYGPFSSYPTPTTSVGAPIPAQWMMRLLYPHPLLRYDGLAPQTALRLWIDELTQIDRSRWYKNKRAINPSAVLNFEGMEEAQPLGDAEIQRVRAEFENDHQGSENAGRLFVAPPGGALEEWGSPIKDMDYPNGWSQLADAILNGLGMTKAAVGMSDATSYSAYFAALKQVHLMTLQPQCNRVGAGFTRNVAPFFADDLIIEVRCPKIDDHEVVFAKVDKGIAAKAITKNEVRKLLDMEVTQEPWGEEIAGFEEPAQQPGMPGAPGQPANGAPASADPGAPPQPPELEKSRPNPGTLASGSKGPEKRLNGYHTKSNYQRVREMISCGK